MLYIHMMLGLLTFASLSYSVFGNPLQDDDDDDGDGVYVDDSIGLTNAEEDDDDGDGVYDDDSIGLTNAEDDDDDGDGAYDDDSIGLTNAEDDDGDGVYDDDSVGLINAEDDDDDGDGIYDDDSPGFTNVGLENWQNCLIPNTASLPYSNYNAGSSASPSDCQLKCQQDTSCQWFNFNPSDGCWLLQYAKKGETSTSSTIGWVTGPKTCSLENCQTCLIPNTASLPYSNYTAGLSPSPSDCQLKCQEDTSCQWFNFIPSDGCWLLQYAKTGESSTSSTIGWVTGPKSCSLKNCQNCLIPNTASLPYSNYKAGLTPSPSDCQLKCQEDTSCQWFNFIPSNGCWLLQYAKTGETSTSSTIGWVTGPKTCNVDDRVEVSATTSN